MKMLFSQFTICELKNSKKKKKLFRNRFQFVCQIQFSQFENIIQTLYVSRNFKFMHVYQKT